MADDKPGPPPEAKDGNIREFDAQAWVGEPDNRTHQEFSEARAKVALVMLLIMFGGISLCIVLLAFARLVQVLLRV